MLQPSFLVSSYQCEIIMNLSPGSSDYDISIDLDQSVLHQVRKAIHRYLYMYSHYAMGLEVRTLCQNQNMDQTTRDYFTDRT